MKKDMSTDKKKEEVTTVEKQNKKVGEPGLPQQLDISNSNQSDENEELRQAWDQIAEGYNQFVTDTEIWLANERLKLVGLKDVRVDTVIEKLEFNSGRQLWNWITNGNPIPTHILSEMKLTNDQIEMIKQQLEHMIHERAGTYNSAILTNPVNIGFGTK